MIFYKVSYTNAHRHFIDFEMRIEKCATKELKIQLPAWRPGRYELGNFSKNIRGFHILDSEGKRVLFKKINKDCWLASKVEGKSLLIRYQYYANELNAGSTYLDESQLYINPVNCFLYLPEQPYEKYQIDLDLPKDYKIACGLKKGKKHHLRAKDFQELFDCPMIASNTLFHSKYEYKKVTYHIWIQGEIHLDVKRFEKDHLAFTKAQVKAFGDIPCREYHFLYQFPDTNSRHGVEHCNSTVITMGPATSLQLESQYNELIGISCHELYHTWNIKSIRPFEMMPYDFTQENYSELGYIAEGVTTYFGDQFLWRSNVFSQSDFLLRMTTAIERHSLNPGRFNYSVAESSFDTWLDGYTLGIPWRKVSIYNEGLLIAFICDVRILKATGGTKSLDDVMRRMYTRFGKPGFGYTNEDYLIALEEVSGVSFRDIQRKLIFGVQDYFPFIKKALTDIGLKLQWVPNTKIYARDYGFLADDNHKVNFIDPNSPSDDSGLWYGDQILAVNGLNVTGNLNFYFQKSEDKIHRLICLRNGSLKKIVLEKGKKTYLPKALLSVTGKEKKFFTAWKR